jgi:sigma-B regulation protein RsbU (phosphoserine phosphatase)
MPQAESFDAWGVCAPAKTVSGDYWDFIAVPGGYDAVIADVSGKGISAALLMASLHASLRSLYLGDRNGTALDPSAIVASLNRQLHQVVEPSRFVTLFLARYCGDGKLLYCNAGHNPGVLVRDGQVEWLGSGSMILGPFPDPGYTTHTVAVRPGDLVCLYTDGVTEAADSAGEQFGEERLGRVLRRVATQSPRDIVGVVQEEVTRWRGDSEATDDITLVLMRITA